MTLSLKIPTNYKFDLSAIVAEFVSKAKKVTVQGVRSALVFL